MELKRKFEIELIDEAYIDESFKLIEINSLQDNELSGVFECELDNCNFYSEAGYEIDIVGTVTVRILVTVDLNVRRVKRSELLSYRILSSNFDTSETKDYISNVLIGYYDSSSKDSVSFGVVLTEKEFCI